MFLRFLLFDRQTSNFTYEIGNRDELICILAGALAAPVESISEYITEIDTDLDLQRRLGAAMRRRRDSNREPLFGRRIGWYAVARWLKPALVVETGTADGLGTAALARALERNRDDGSPGMLLSFDVVSDAGWMLDEQLRTQVRLFQGDTTETLPRELAGRTIELALALDHASPKAVLISDNSHATTALADLAREAELTFALYRERPIRHFYPGAGLGIAVAAKP
jgi:hypothetical protein